MARILYAIMPAADGGWLTFTYGDDSMGWQKIVTSLLQILAEHLGGWQGAGLLWLLEQLKRMGVLNVELPQGIRFSNESGAVSAAPDEFKQAVREFLAGLVAKINRPLVKLILTRAVDLLTDAVLDELWNRLFGATTATAGADNEASMFAAEFEAVA